MENIRVLVNGVKIPSIGLGTYKSGDVKITIEAVKLAIETGYRLIDTASFYENEEGVGKGIIESGVPREDIFITTKLWQNEQGYENTYKAFENSIKRLGVNYLDLYLIHWPTEISSETWRAMEELYEAGKIKAIGVCNFKKHHLEELMKTARIKPMVNQIQFHPELIEEELVQYCKEQEIQVISWGPLMRGKIFSISLLKELADKYNKTIPQLTLRWNLEKGLIPIPKSSKIERIKENFKAFDFKLSKEDIDRIDGLNINERFSNPPSDSTFFD